LTLGAESKSEQAAAMPAIDTTNNRTKVEKAVMAASRVARLVS
jgi:hypothetical protein